MKNIYFDHTFNVDKGHQFFKQLGKMGFALEKQIVEHPGKAFCRFIKLNSASSRRVSYLEFVDVRDPKSTRRYPGLSFGYNKNLERLFHKVKSKLKCSFGHKNYEWKKDSKSRLPGWNFLTFKNTGIKGYFPWVTEYEPHPKRKPVRKPGKHKNTVYRLLKIELDLNKNGIRFYERLFSKKIAGQMLLSCRTELSFRNSKTNSFKRVVLACKDLHKFRRVAKSVKDITYEGQSAALIENPSTGWDIVVLQR